MLLDVGMARSLGSEELFLYDQLAMAGMLKSNKNIIP